MENELKKLQKSIRNNPPLDEKGKPEYWNRFDWEKELDRSIPNWRELLNKPEIWSKIRNIRPREHYGALLQAILTYAPDEILSKYLKSNEDVEQKSSMDVVLRNNGERLSSRLWKMLDKKTKSTLFSKVKGVIEIGHPHDITLHHVLQIMIPVIEGASNTKRKKSFEYSSLHSKFQLSHSNLQVYFYEAFDILHPLWIKFSAVVKEANDKDYEKRVEEHEENAKYILKKKFEKIKSLVQLLITETYLPKQNIMFDPSLLVNLNEELADFINETRDQFNFFVSKSFYDAVKSEEESNLQKLAEFFEVKKQVSWDKIRKFFKEFDKIIIPFEIKEEIYKNKYPEFYKSLKDLEEKKLSKDLFKIVFEEWVFLQEFSWLVAKSKKIFEKFKEAGAVSIEFSKRKFEEIIEKIKDSKTQKILKKLRKIGKFIAVGISPFIIPEIKNDLIQKIMAAGVGTFALFDPPNICNEARGDTNDDSV